MYSTFSTLISRSPRSPPLHHAPHRSSHSKRVPPSISFRLSSKLESLSSLFVFRRPPLLRWLSLRCFFLLRLFVLRTLLQSPLFPLDGLSRSLSLASCLSSTLRFLSSSKIGTSLFSLGFFLPLPFLQLEVLILFTTGRIFRFMFR